MKDVICSVMTDAEGIKDWILQRIVLLQTNAMLLLPQMLS